MVRRNAIVTLISGLPYLGVHYLVEVWDGWPDGNFERTFSPGEVERTKHIQVHWPCITSGPMRGSAGSEHADKWKDGHRSQRRCQGIIWCDSPSCRIVVRPKVSHTTFKDQLAHECACGGRLRRSDPRCPARQLLYKFSGGVHFIHSGTHNHPRPTHILHLSAKEEAAFEELVVHHPKAGPLELSVGAQTLHGPGQPASVISSLLLNKDRIKYEHRKITQTVSAATGGGGDRFLSAFALFCQNHPGFVIQSIIGDVTVISVQTAVLRSELVKDSPLLGADENVNGIVSDAAHGFWQDRNALLIISSTFSPRLRCWVPGIFSYANGATTEHYRLHFLALFQGIAHEARERGISVSDSLFANVCASFCFIQGY